MQLRNPSIKLKDGSRLKKIERTILRFRRGDAALMRVLYAEEDVHGFRLYGMNIVGDEHSAYAHDCVPVTNAERKNFDSYMTDRRESYLHAKMSSH